jgi:hypothetical protein
MQIGGMAPILHPLLAGRRRKELTAMARKFHPIFSVVLLFLALGLIEFWPALTGKIPLPADIIMQFPIYHNTPEARNTKFASHSDLGVESATRKTDCISTQ